MVAIFGVSKERGFWHVDDLSNGFSKDDGMLVAGIPDMTEAFTDGRSARVVIAASDRPFPGPTNPSRMRTMREAGASMKPACRHRPEPT